MIGLLSYGAYIPRTRLPLSAIGGRPAKDGGPEKAVAWNDEDAVTLGVAAAIHCLRGFDRSKVDLLIFASTTLPFQEKQASALVARVLDLPRAVQTSDQTGTTRAGTIALRAAFDAIKAGSARCALVIASDVRLAAPGSGLEANFGDGAAAFLVGDGDAIAAPATATPELKSLTLNLAKEFKLRLEGEGLPADRPLKHVPGVGTSKQNEKEKEESFLEFIAKKQPGNWLLVTHPAYDEAETRAIGHPGYENVAADRDGITKMLTSPRVLAAIKTAGIRLISYADLGSV